MKLSFVIAFLTLFFSSLNGQGSVDSLHANSHVHAKNYEAGIVALERQHTDTIKSDNQDLRKLQNQLEKQEVNFRYERLFTWLLIVLLSIYFAYYQRKKRQENETKNQELLAQIESLKKQQATWSVSVAPVSESIALNKMKIEQLIGNKLGESSWLILNVLLQQPDISNKAIAKKVSLSVEGVSSSLRRMYITFAVKSSHNKKVALITKAVRMSMGKEEEV